MSMVITICACYQSEVHLLCTCHGRLALGGQQFPCNPDDDSAASHVGVHGYYMCTRSVERVVACWSTAAVANLQPPPTSCGGRINYNKKFSSLHEGKWTNLSPPHCMISAAWMRRERVAKTQDLVPANSSVSGKKGWLRGSLSTSPLTHEDDGGSAS
jgi:hypothetical protein